MARRRPPTVEQLSNLAELMEKLLRITEELRGETLTMYGADDPRSIRADEVYGAVQRLEWSLQRSHSASARGGLKVH
jgi:hypothetical protein